MSKKKKQKCDCVRNHTGAGNQGGATKTTQQQAELQHCTSRYQVHLEVGERNRKQPGSLCKGIFHESRKKKQVMNEKKKLKGENIWLYDELTPYRRKLAYLSRQSVRDGHAHQTWTTSGKAFIKKTATSRATKVRQASDIPGNNI
jgi:hypothetical protein